MRALLYKDLYMICKYNGFFMAAVILFIVIAGLGTESLFFAVYPPVIMVALGYSSLAYDERSGWLQYADALPYGRKKIVASKYLLSMFCGLTAMILLVISMTAFRLARGQFDFQQVAIAAAVVVVMSTVYIGVLLPISFWLGTEKGRLVYIILTVLACCSGYSIPMPKVLPQVSLGAIAVLVAIGVILIWSISYGISVKVYQKRKL